MQQRNYFEEWQNKIQNPMNYNMGYHKDYVGTVFIGIFNEDFSGTPIPSASKYIIELEEAWPNTISGIDLNSGTNELMTFQVNMSYKRWTRNKWRQKHAVAFSGPRGSAAAADDFDLSFDDSE